MDAIELLPNFTLKPSSGVVTELFLDKAIFDFHKACHWVRLLPYGPNSEESDSTILFEEGQGTCTAKHGIIARLAGEQDMVIERVVGFYRLDEEILQGADKILKRAGIPFVPQMHCFLQYNTQYVDLTDGNCTGKKASPSRYDVIVRVSPDMTRSEESRLYHWALFYYFRLFPELRRAGKSTILNVLEECKSLWRCCLYNESNQ